MKMKCPRQPVIQYFIKAQLLKLTTEYKFAIFINVIL